MKFKWNSYMEQLDLIDMYKTFHPKTINFTFFTSAHRTFSRIDHILGHKSGLGKFKKIEIIPSIFSDHNVVRLDVNCRKIPWTVEPGSLQSMGSLRVGHD